MKCERFIVNESIINKKKIFTLTLLLALLDYPIIKNIGTVLRAKCILSYENYYKTKVNHLKTAVCSCVNQKNQY